ncbi:MAG: endolytic transglycosylase MltG [Rhodospirillales bacterium]|nr:endolytic transglycosylase MltG [Rhodospirillales bacterium]
MRRLVAVLVFLFVALGAAGGGVFMWGYGKYIKPGPLITQATIVIEHGLGVDAIAEKLTFQKVIVDPLVFRVAARVLKLGRSLKAGEFSFPPRASQREILEILEAGKTVVRRITIAEGLTTSQVMELVLQTEGLEGDVKAFPGEGVLLPETYHFTFGDSRQDIIERMETQSRLTLEKLWQGREKGLPLRTPEEALILASIVEKETGVARERILVAGVFINRLRKNMRLQSDPTVVYVISEGTGRMDRALTRKDLMIDSPYNTYKNRGLPPSPISNPGKASIEAVLHPAKTDALYFVADGTGGHAFARTLKEHNRNVAKWRKIRRNKSK